MAFLFLFLLIFLTGYLVYRERTGAILCLLTLFPELVGIILNKAGWMGLNMAIKYALFACVLWLSRKLINTDWKNLWRNPLSVLLYVLIAVMIWHNEVHIGGAILNPEIATFQLNVILRILIPYVILMLSADREDILDDYCRSIPWWGLFLFVAFMLLMGFSSINMSDRMTIIKETGMDSISLSRFAAATLLGSLICFMRPAERILKISYLVILVLAAFMLLLASQRGTIIGCAAAAVLALGFILIRRDRTKEFIGISVAIAAIVWILLTSFNFEIMNRFQDLERFQQSERYADYGKAWRAFKENGFFTGLGSMGYMEYTHGFRQYPHNMALELMSEYGIVGLIYALVNIIYGGWMSYKILIRAKETNVEMAIPIIWCALLASVMVSGSFVTNAIFYLMSGMLILCYQNPPEEDEDEEDDEAYEGEEEDEEANFV